MQRAKIKPNLPFGSLVTGVFSFLPMSERNASTVAVCFSCSSRSSYFQITILFCILLNLFIYQVVSDKSNTVSLQTTYKLCKLNYENKAFGLVRADLSFRQ